MRFLKDQQGSFAVFAALAMPAVAGSAAFGIDLGYAQYTRITLNAASDAAALGAVLALPNTASATSRALDLEPFPAVLRRDSGWCVDR